MKPRIKLFHRNPTRWTCEGSGWTAVGGSPLSAYNRWQTMVRVAREDAITIARAFEEAWAWKRSFGVTRV